MSKPFTFTISYNSVRITRAGISAQSFFTFNLGKETPDETSRVSLQIYNDVESDYTKYYEYGIRYFFNLNTQPQTDPFIDFLIKNEYITRTKTLTFNPVVFETNITDVGGRTIFTVTISKPPPKGKVSISSGKMPRFCVEIWREALSIPSTSSNPSSYNDQVRDRALTICPGQDLTDPNPAGAYTYQTNDNSFFQFRRCEVSQLPSSDDIVEVYNLSMNTLYGLNDFLMSSAVDGIHDQNNVKPSENISQINRFKTSIQSLVMKFIQDKLSSFDCPHSSLSGGDIEDEYANMVSCVTNTSPVIADEADNSPGASSDPAVAAAASSEHASASFQDDRTRVFTNQAMTSSETIDRMSNQVSFLANNSTYFPNITTNDATPFQLMDTGVSLVVNEFTNLYIKATNCKFIFHDGSIEILMCFDFKPFDGIMELYYVVVYNITIDNNSYIFKTYTKRNEVNSNYNHYVKMNGYIEDISTKFNPVIPVEQLILFVGISMGKTNNDLLQFLSAIGVNNSCAMVFFDKGVPTSALPTAATAAAAAPSADPAAIDPASVTLNHKIINGKNFEILLKNMLNSKYFNKVKLSWYFIANDRVNISMINYLTYMIKSTSETGEFPLSTYLKSVNFGSIHTYRGTLISYISSTTVAKFNRQSIEKSISDRDLDRIQYNKYIKELYFSSSVATRPRQRPPPRTFVDPCSKEENIDEIIKNISIAESVCDEADPFDEDSIDEGSFDEDSLDGDNTSTDDRKAKPWDPRNIISDQVHGLISPKKSPQFSAMGLPTDTLGTSLAAKSDRINIHSSQTADPRQFHAIGSTAAKPRDPRNIISDQMRGVLSPDRLPAMGSSAASFVTSPAAKPMNARNNNLSPNPAAKPDRRNIGSPQMTAHLSGPDNNVVIRKQMKPGYNLNVNISKNLIGQFNRAKTQKNPGGGNRKRRIKKTKRTQKSKKTIKRKTKQNRKTLKRKNKYKKHT